MKESRAVSGGKGMGALVVSLVGVLAIFGGVAEAKKGGGKAAVEEVTNVPIVEGDIGTDRIGITDVNFKIGKKFKGKVAGKVEITTQITGSVDDYIANNGFGGSRLISPQGRTVAAFIVPFDFGGDYDNRAYGPMTLTPNSPNQVCFIQPCSNFFDDPLGPPWNGTAGDPELNRFFGVRMRGTWTLELNNLGIIPGTGVLNLARLRVKPAKPIED